MSDPMEAFDDVPLRTMVEELRAESDRELDWNSVETKLMRSIASRATPPREAPNGLLRAFAFAAAAGFIALGIGLLASTSPGAPAEARSTRILDFTEVTGAVEQSMTEVSLGDEIVTGAEAATFSEPGLARWTLEPHGKLVVAALEHAEGDRPSLVAQTVRLESGAIRVEVVPRPASEGWVEPFAVEVGGTRVAVHGTKFRVVRTSSGLEVDVDHGTVAVGPVGHHGLTVGRILVGPSRAAFSLDGGRSSAFLPREGNVLLSGQQPSAAIERPTIPPAGLGLVTPPPPPPRAGSVVAAPADRQPEPDGTAASLSGGSEAAEPGSAAPRWLTRDGIVEGLERCFERTYRRSSPDVRLLVRSTFTIRTKADGSVESARFDPPLEPEFLGCAGSVIAGRFEEGPSTLVLPVQFGQPAP